MAKIVKLTDEVGAALEKWAEKDDTSLAGEIKMLLDMREGKGVADSISARLDKMATYLEKKFVDLEAALDGAVLSNSSYNPKSSSNSNAKVIPWPIVQDLMFDILPDGAEEWLPGMEEAAHASDYLDMGTFLIEDNVLVSDDAWGKAQWLRITPRVEDYLKSACYN